MTPEPFHQTSAARAVSAAILAGFVIFLVCQFNNVFLTHDDWGLATLSYTTDQAISHGTGHDLSSLIDFLYGEYMNWSGRTMAALVAIELFQIGLPATRLAQVIIIMVICLASIKAVSPAPLLSLNIIAPVVCFLCLPRYTLLGGIYWFTAAAVGMWGIAPMLLAGCRVRARGRLDLLSSLLLALAALFSEILSAAAICFVIGLTLAEGAAGGRLAGARRNALLCIPVALAAMFVVLAPGNFHRAAVSDYSGPGALMTVITNTVVLLVALGSQTTVPFLILIGWSAVVLVLSARVSKSLGWREWQVMLACLLGTVPLLLVLPPAVFPIWFALLVLIILRGLGDGSTPPVLLALIFAGAGSVAMVIAVTPHIPGRSVIPFVFLLFPLVTFAFTKLPMVLRQGPAIRLAVMLVFGAAAAFGAANTVAVYMGYAANTPQHLFNDAMLRETHRKLAAGEVKAPLTVHLLQLKDMDFAETMPYKRPIVSRDIFIEKWIKRYYDLPPDVSFVWDPYR